MPTPTSTRSRPLALRTMLLETSSRGCGLREGDAIEGVRPVSATGRAARVASFLGVTPLLPRGVRGGAPQRSEMSADEIALYRTGAPNRGAPTPPSHTHSTPTLGHTQHGVCTYSVKVPTRFLVFSLSRRHHGRPHDAARRQAALLLTAGRRRGALRSCCLALTFYCFCCSASLAALRALTFSSSSFSESMRCLKVASERFPSRTKPTIPSRLFFAPARIDLNE